MHGVHERRGLAGAERIEKRFAAFDERLLLLRIDLASDRFWLAVSEPEPTRRRPWGSWGECSSRRERVGRQDGFDGGEGVDAGSRGGGDGGADAGGKVGRRSRSDGLLSGATSR